MATRSPADAIVALRSMGRRWRGLFAGLDEDESPDALAQRPGSDGMSALGLAEAAEGTLGWLRTDLEHILVHDHPQLVDPALRANRGVGLNVDRRIDSLASVADQVADRVEGVPAGDWTRSGALPGRGDVDALIVLWDAVDDVVAKLRAAEATLREVRGRPV